MWYRVLPLYAPFSALCFTQPAFVALADECILLHPTMGEYVADFPLLPLNLALKAIICHRTGDLDKVRVEPLAQARLARQS